MGEIALFAIKKKKWRFWIIVSYYKLFLFYVKGFPISKFPKFKPTSIKSFSENIKIIFLTLPNKELTEF